MIAALFDSLVFLLIVAPILTGGVWIEKPGMKLELTELAVPVLIIAAFAYFSTEARARSWTLRKGKELFQRWSSFLEKSPGLALSYGTVFVSLLWMFTSLRRHWALHSKAFDLGIFTNTIWNLTHGFGYVSSVKGGINLFADHQSPIFWVLAPVFRLFPSPETLLVIQAIGLSLGAAAVYLLAKQYAREKTFLVAAIPLLYWCYLPVRQANLFDFHPEVFMLPLFLWALVGIQSQDFGERALGWLAFLAALACKESAGPIAVGIGLAWIAGAAPQPRRGSGIIAVALGLLVFIIDLKLVPHWLGTNYAYGSLYQHLSDGPMDWIRTVFAKSRFKFLFATLAPLAFLPLGSPRALIAVLPAYAMLFLSAGDVRLSPQFHYGIEPAIGLFWAAASFQKPWRIPKISFPVWVAFWAFLSFGRSEVYWIRKFEPTEHARWIQTQALRCVSPDASLTATGVLVAQTATRHWVQQIPDLGVGSQNDCVWVDHSLEPWPLSLGERVQWEKELPAKGYVPFFTCGTTVVYQRQNYSGACLRCLPECRENTGLNH